MSKKSSEFVIDEKWYAFAQDDLKIVRTLYQQKEKIHRGICFHAQQYAEKILKGILAAKRIKPPRVHDVVALVRGELLIG